MGEYELLDLLNRFHTSQNTVLAQLISLHLAIVVATFYFLHRSGLAMKIAIFSLYSLGGALFLGQMHSYSVQIVGARAELRALPELSAIGAAVIENAGPDYTNWISITGNIGMLAAWLGASAFLFLWKPSKDQN